MKNLKKPGALASTTHLSNTRCTTDANFTHNGNHEPVSVRQPVAAVGAELGARG
ncbi:hypothetical protein [Lacticaseibacillus suibinensis]|uniref:hypothetical protein n=1 Tax=Lacticaseibacillus suibinensis TaxID=2486011 RepID=UPI0019432C58|nr:hypothetical protein [Lacticaseibacillus suibinensis]